MCRFQLQGATAESDKLRPEVCQVVEAGGDWIQLRNPHERSDPSIDPQEAEVYWLKDVQVSLESKPKFRTWQQQFGLFKDDSGVWRCGGRLANAGILFIFL